MGTVVADMTMSVDGFIADPDDGVGPLFDWYGAGSEEFIFPGTAGRRGCQRRALSTCGGSWPRWARW